MTQSRNSLSRISSVRSRRSAASVRRRNLLNPAQKSLEHRVFIIASVEPECEFIEVRLQVLLRNRMVNATKPVLNQTPEAFQCVRVGAALDVDPGFVMDTTMNVALFRQ